jgi:hypothetical protein
MAQALLALGIDHARAPGGPAAFVVKLVSKQEKWIASWSVLRTKATGVEAGE